MDATGGDGEARARVERLLRAAARLVDPADPLHREALAVLPAETGLSPEGVALALGCSVERGASDEELGRLLAPVAFGAGWFLRLASSPWTAAMLLLEIASFAAWMTALSEMKLSAAFPMSAIGYVLVIVTGWTLFHEPASLTQALGGAIILAGVWLIGRGGPEEAGPR